MAKWTNTATLSVSVGSIGSGKGGWPSTVLSNIYKLRKIIKNDNIYFDFLILIASS